MEDTVSKKTRWISYDHVGCGGVGRSVCGVYGVCVCVSVCMVCVCVSVCVYVVVVCVCVCVFKKGDREAARTPVMSVGYARVTS